MLEGLIQHWLAEATRLEVTIEDQTLTEKMARLMFEVDVPTKMKEQEKEWDPTGNGETTCSRILPSRTLCTCSSPSRTLPPVCVPQPAR